MSWIDDAVPENLMCRDTGIRHQWTPFFAEREKGGFVETLQCARCFAEKVRHITTSGAIVRTRFRYPDGYVRTGGGRVSAEENAAVRLASFRRRWSL